MSFEKGTIEEGRILCKMDRYQSSTNCLQFKRAEHFSVFRSFLTVWRLSGAVQSSLNPSEEPLTTFDPFCALEKLQEQLTVFYSLP